MITCLVVSFIVYKLLGKNPFKKTPVKVPVCEKNTNECISK